MDAMSDAIEGADVMLYAVSLQYKESANVRAVAQDAVDSRSDLLACSASPVYLTAWLFSVSIGGQLRSSARAGHDPVDDAEGLLAEGLA